MLKPIDNIRIDAPNAPDFSEILWICWHQQPLWLRVLWIFSTVFCGGVILYMAIDCEYREWREWHKKK